MTSDSSDGPLLDAAAFSRRAKVALLISASRVDGARDAAAQLGELFHDTAARSGEGRLQIADHLIEVCYVLMSRDSEQHAIEMLETVTVALEKDDDPLARALVARAHATAAVAATRAQSGETAERESAALSVMGSPALEEIERLIGRIEQHGPTRPELAQLMIAKIRCLDGIDEARSRREAKVFVDRFAEADDPALRDGAEAMRRLL